MDFILNDYFSINFNKAQFDGIITDIPYKGCLTDKLGEREFSFNKFLKKTFEETKSDSFLITFANFLCAIDLINIGRKIGWKFHTYLIWNKLPTRNWISWSFPLRHIEFIMFFNKGSFKFSFKTGEITQPYKRKSFGGILKDQNKQNSNKFAYKMFSEIIEIPVPGNRIHPTEKPIEFSSIFSKIVGKDKFVLDPFVGSGNLLEEFPNSIGVDVVNYGKFKSSQYDSYNQSDFNYLRNDKEKNLDGYFHL